VQFITIFFTMYTVCIDTSRQLPLPIKLGRFAGIFD